MSKERELLKELITKDMVQYYYPKLVKNVEAILAQPEQEPVAWKGKAYGNLHHVDYGNSIPLYLAPLKREPLRDAEIAKLWGESYSGTTQMVRNFARAIEKAHGIGGGK